MINDHYSLLEQYRDVRLCWDELRRKDAEINALEAENGKLRAALEKLQDPDFWVSYLGKALR